MKILLLGTLFLLVSIPVGYAGQGVITETDDRIIVEYNGTPDDKIAVPPEPAKAGPVAPPATNMKSAESALQNTQKKEPRPDAMSQRRSRRPQGLLQLLQSEIRC
jgi:hypothetical protein